MWSVVWCGGVGCGGMKCGSEQQITDIDCLAPVGSSSTGKERRWISDAKLRSSLMRRQD